MILPTNKHLLAEIINEPQVDVYKLKVHRASTETYNPTIGKEVYVYVRKDDVHRAPMIPEKDTPYYVIQEISVLAYEEVENTNN